MGWRPDLQDGVPDAEKLEVGQRSCWEHQEASLEVLPDQDGALPDRAAPQLDEESAHPAMLVVPVPEPGSGAPLPLQGVPGVEGPEGGPVGGGAEGDREVEGPGEDPGPPGGREMRAGGSGLPLHHGSGKAGAEEDAVSEVSEAELLSLDRPGRRAKRSLQCAATAQTADRKRTVHNLAVI